MRYEGVGRALCVDDLELNLVDEMRAPLALATPHTPARRWQQALRVARANGLGDALRFARNARGNDAYRDQWLDFLDDFARLHALRPASIDLAMKPLNEFVIAGLPVCERIRLLRAHFQVLSQYAGQQTTEALWSGQAFSAGDLKGKSGSYDISLCSTSVYRTRKEGELTVALRDKQADQVLSRLTLLLGTDEQGDNGVLIGGIQGPRFASAKQMIVSATRDLFGLRPRDAVLGAGLAIAHAVGARQAWAIPNSLHVHNTREKRQQKRLFVDYDAFWAERGAKRDWRLGWTFDVPAMVLRTGSTANGRRRDDLKELIWHKVQEGFLGRKDATRQSDVREAWAAAE